jgi:hypothetical protein
MSHCPLTANAPPNQRHFTFGFPDVSPFLGSLIARLVIAPGVVEAGGHQSGALKLPQER